MPASTLPTGDVGPGRRGHRGRRVTAAHGGEQLPGHGGVVLVVRVVGRGGDAHDGGVVQRLDGTAAAVGGVDAGLEGLLPLRVHRRHEVRLGAHLPARPVDLCSGAFTGVGERSRLVPLGCRLAGVGQGQAERGEEDEGHGGERRRELAADRPAHARILVSGSTFRDVSAGPAADLTNRALTSPARPRGRQASRPRGHRGRAASPAWARGRR